jgi:hypothetical protein
MSLVVSATPMSSCSEESDDDKVVSTVAVADKVEYNAASATVAPMLVDEAVATDVVVVVVVAASPNRANAAFAANSLTDKLSLFDNAALPTLVRLSTIFDPLRNGRFFGMLLVYPEL